MPRVSKRVSWIATIVLIALAPAVLWTQRWNIFDALRLRGYTPHSEIVRLATEAGLNDSSRRLFYVYHPALEDKESFNQHCSSSEKTIVLGCYVGGRGIYLYDVTDERLNGIEQVTAAHETLHAAYERLSSSERTKVDAMLNSAFDAVTNERIKTTIDEYRKNGADINNELHSILATEVRGLPPELEAYYSRYFADRSKVVAYSEQYELAFTQLKQRVAAADQRLQELKMQIDSLQADIDIRASQLKSERAKLDSYLSSNNIEQYNAQVVYYNSLVAGYNSRVRQTRSLIDEYNALVAERNAIAIEENELLKSIDSRPDTLQTQ